MTNRPLYLMLTAALALTGAGCGSDDDKADTAPTPAAKAPATTKAAAAAPYGIYMRTMTKADLARTAKLRDEHGPNQQTPPPGRYRLVIAKGAGQDVLKVNMPGAADDFTVGMDVSAEPSSLFLSDYVDPSKGAFCGPEIPAAVGYKVARSGDTLRLAPESSDPCADRDSILTGTWKQG